jgi:iron complex transport system permease protein
MSAPDTRTRHWLIALAAMAAGMAGLRLVIGQGFDPAPTLEVLELRAGRAAIGLTVGAALSVAGVLLQALLRNPLASPYVVGISSGAALGVMLNMTVGAGLAAALGLAAGAGDHLAAMLGATATMAVVYLLGQKRGRLDPLGLLLVGVIVNAINGAAMMFLNYMAGPTMRGQMSLWMLGYLSDNAGWPLTFWVACSTAAGTAGAWAMGRSMDLATFSDAEAHSLGVRLSRLRLAMFLVSGLLVSGSVVLAGPIGFVGLICPHLVRLLIGPGHRPLILGSACAGAALVIGADIAVKLLDRGQGLMPIGILTAMIGGPVFLLMLRPQLGRGAEG